MKKKPYSPACERNQQAILQTIEPFLTTACKVLEIGSGTGQHAVYFAKSLPHILWQTSDLPCRHDGIKLWLTEAQLPNLLSPIPLDIDNDLIPKNQYEVIYTANTFHIMSFKTVEECVKKSAKGLKQNGLFIVYGPFNMNGMFTSQSNADFDNQLKIRNPVQGIRDLESIDFLMQAENFERIQITSMPANNFILIYQKL